MSVNSTNGTLEPLFLFGNTTIQRTSYPGCLLYLSTHLRGNSKLMLTKMVFVSIKTIFIQSEKCLYSSGKISQHLLILPQCCHKTNLRWTFFFFFCFEFSFKRIWCWKRGFKNLQWTHWVIYCWTFLSLSPRERIYYIFFLYAFTFLRILQKWKEVGNRYTYSAARETLHFLIAHATSGMAESNIILGQRLCQSSLIFQTVINPFLCCSYSWM